MDACIHILTRFLSDKPPATTPKTSSPLPTSQARSEASVPSGEPPTTLTLAHIPGTQPKASVPSSQPLSPNTLTLAHIPGTQPKASVPSSQPLSPNTLTLAHTQARSRRRPCRPVSRSPHPPTAQTRVTTIFTCNSTADLIE